MDVKEVYGLHFEELNDDWKKKLYSSYLDLIRKVGDEVAKTFIVYVHSDGSFAGWGSDLSD